MGDEDDDEEEEDEEEDDDPEDEDEDEDDDGDDGDVASSDTSSLDVSFVVAGLVDARDGEDPLDGEDGGVEPES